jgi:hypothetical protein
MASPGKFTCESCGKSYSWKPELAGKKVKCKCGTPLRVPATDPAEDSFSDGFDDLAALGEGTVKEAPAAAEVAPVVKGKAPAAKGKKCPACESPVAADAVLCVNCGHNLKTGKKLKTSTAEVTPAYRSYAVVGSEEAMSARKTKIIGLSIAGALVVGLTIMVSIMIPAVRAAREKDRLARQNAGPPVLEKIIENTQNAGGFQEAMKNGTLLKGTEDPNKQRAAEALEDLRHRTRLNQRYIYFYANKGIPARAWLEASPKTRIYSFPDHAKSLDFIKEMEDLGLSEILTIEKPVPGFPDDMITYGLLATLPQDADKRKKIFAWYDRIPKHNDYPGLPQDDIGQKNLFISLSD